MDPPYTEGGSEMPYREERETRRLGEPSRFIFIRAYQKRFRQLTELLFSCLFCLVCIRLILAVRIGSQHMQRQRDKDDADTAIRQCFQQMSALHQQNNCIIQPTHSEHGKSKRCQAIPHTQIHTEAQRQQHLYMLHAKRSEHKGRRHE